MHLTLTLERADLKDQVREALLAIRDRRRAPGVGWGLASKWIPVQEVADELDIPLSSAITGLQKLVALGLAEFDKVHKGIGEPTMVKTNEI